MLLIPVCCALLAILYAAGMRTSLLIFLLSASIFVVSTVLSLFYFVSDDITGAGITEATFFHLLYGFDGLDVFNFSTYVALTLAAFATVGLVCFIAWRICARQSKSLFQYRPSRVIHVTVIGALSIFAVGVHPATVQTIDVAQELYDSRYASVLNEALRSFDDVKPAAQGRSLVYIYAESLERTFLSHRTFPGLAPKLSEMEKSSLSIHGIGQAPLTDWTVAGMVASQCGMPLATFRHDGNNLSDLSSFIPGASCIGDLLHERGYQLAYVGGADLDFAGKGRFYSDHQFKDITGLNELRAHYGEDIPVSKWGVYDDTLFQSALKKFRELSIAGKPFALYVLTLDTHAPNGYRTPACANRAELQYGNGANSMLNAVKCSDELISGFVKKIEAEAGKDVVIVVASDHLQMRSAASDLLDQSKDGRENLFMVRSFGIEPKLVTKPATTMDIAPTILSLLGWDIQAMALGRNLLGEEQTLVEKYGQEKFYEMVKAWRMSLWQMWKRNSSSADQVM